MRRSFVPVAVSALLLGACSPAQYKVNPPSPEKVQEAVPESQQAGYMRILGDLRWDQLTSKKAWMGRFSDCLTDRFSTTRSAEVAYLHSVGTFNYLVPSHDYEIRNTFAVVIEELPASGSLSTEDYIRWIITRKLCRNFSVGGVSISPVRVMLSANSGTTSGTMTSSVDFDFPDASQGRAFKSAIAQKYKLTPSGYCSKYTCWNLGDMNETGSITAKPTPYTVSILDNVKIDKSDI